MSPGDARVALAAVSTAELIEEIGRRLEATCLGDGEPEEATARELLSLGTRLYSARVQTCGVEFPPTTADVTTTDAVTVACALTRQQNLTPFDLALWFGRSTGGPR